jgi:hypothetical protein
MEKKIYLNGIQKYPLLVAVIAQILVLFFLRNIFVLIQIHITQWSFVFFQGLLSAILCQLIFKLPKWFIVISFLFPIFFTAAWTYLHFSAGIYGIIFIILALTFSHTLKERVPLYLTNNTTHENLKNIIVEKKIKKFLDLGSGTGVVVRALSSNDVESNGVESAPMLWLYSSLWSKLTKKGTIFRKNIWQTEFQSYDLIYAFLSPAIMEKLFKKIKSEMRPGTIFISNSFVVPNVKASEVYTLDDGRKTKLYLYLL